MLQKSTPAVDRAVGTKGEEESGDIGDAAAGICRDLENVLSCFLVALNCS